MAPVSTRSSSQNMVPGRFPPHTNPSENTDHVDDTGPNSTSSPSDMDTRTADRQSFNTLVDMISRLSSQVSKLQTSQQELKNEVRTLQENKRQTTSSSTLVNEPTSDTPTLLKEQSTGRGEQNVLTPIGSMGFPTLSNKKDESILDWITDVECTIIANNCSWDRFEWALPLFLSGPSKDLWRRLKRDLPEDRTPSWSNFTKLLIESEHPETKQLQLRLEMSNKKYSLGSSLEQFCKEFRALEELISNSEMAFADKYAYFFKSLSGCRDIQRQLKRDNPKSMTQAYNIVTIYEDDYSRSTSTKRTSLRETSMVKRESKGLLYCRYCKIKCDHEINNCPRINKRQSYGKHNYSPYNRTGDTNHNQLNHLEKELNSEILNISNGELSVSFDPDQLGYQVPRYKIMIGNHPMSMIIDSGASHNYINEETTLKIPMTLENTKPCGIKLANGNVETSTKVFNGNINIGGTLQKTKCLILKLNKSIDLILGQPWLRENGPEMSFTTGICTFNQGTTKVKLIPEINTISKLDTTEHSILAQFKKEFPRLFRKTIGKPKEREYKHKIEVTDSKIIRIPPYAMSPQKLEVVNQFVSDSLKDGVITESQSPWSSPLLLVPKKDASYRVCVDYRALNSITKKDAHPLPRVDECFRLLKDSSFYTSLDLRSGYWQLELDPESAPKTAFSTRNGHYEFRVMPFGLVNAPASFQRFINNLLAPYLDKIVIVYLDDILIFSTTLEKHIQDIKTILSILNKEDLVLNMEKCIFAKQTIKFLGHVLSHNGISTDPTKVEKILTWREPTNITELRGFIALCSYYRKFIDHFATLCLPLTELTKGSPRKKSTILWSDNCQKAFEALKIAITSSPILRQADYTKPFYIDTDASDFALGAVLQQYFYMNGKDILLPLAYDSRKLNATQQKYSAQERELLAIVSALETWSYIIEGCKIIVRTDHESLKHIYTQPQPGRGIARFIDRLTHFSPEIRYITGKSNIIPDALSRRTDTTSPVEVSAEIFLVTTVENSYKGITFKIIEDYIKDPNSFDFSKHPPFYIITDKGKAFTSNGFITTLATYHIEHCHTSGYHPRSNGRVEKFNGILEKLLRKTIYERPLSDWEDVLPEVLRIYRHRPNSEGYSPLYLAIGRKPDEEKSPLHTASQDTFTMQQDRIRSLDKLKYHRAHEAKLRYQKAMTRAAREEPKKILKTYHIGDWVLRKRVRKHKLEPAYDGPFEIIEATPTNNYKLKSPGGFVLLGTYSVERLTPAYIKDKPTNTWLPRKN